MKTLKIDLKSPKIEILKEIAQSILDGQTVVFPTDTCYGLAANATIQSSVENVYKIKNRDLEKQLSCIYRNLEQIKLWTNLDERQEKILKDNLPGAFTFVLTPNKNYPLWGETVGVRIPNFEFTNMLAEELNVPYTSTSANLAGAPSCYSIQEFLEQIKDHQFKPDLIIDAGILPHNEPSTVVDIREIDVKILREGPGKLKSF
jgi:L-threonylcarbamoyladenylate synthase